DAAVDEHADPGEELVAVAAAAARAAVLDQLLAVDIDLPLLPARQRLGLVATAGDDRLALDLPERQLHRQLALLAQDRRQPGDHLLLRGAFADDEVALDQLLQQPVVALDLLRVDVGQAAQQPLEPFAVLAGAERHAPVRELAAA